MMRPNEALHSAVPHHQQHVHLVNIFNRRALATRHAQTTSLLSVPPIFLIPRIKKKE